MTAMDLIPPLSFDPERATFKKADLWINGLFLLSLSLSLATALLSVLVKQWLHVSLPNYSFRAS